MTQTFSHTAAYLWSLAELLRGDFKQSQYGHLILPLTILRRLECVLEKTKPKVLAEAEKRQYLTEKAKNAFLLKAAGQSFFNTSTMNLSLLGTKRTKRNLLQYVDSFSADAREIFGHFSFNEFVTKLDEANLLFKVVQRVAATDLHPEAISNHEMGLVFEELIRRFAESSNEMAGEHFTPRDIVRLTTSLVFMGDDELLTQAGIIRTLYDPTAGTGGFLSSGMEYMHELNAEAVLQAFGQELNPESYAICKGDMLIKGQNVSRLKLGNTLSDDQLDNAKFDYMLSNPPFGVDWNKVAEGIRAEHREQSFSGRFGPGLPRVSDSSLLFLLHLLSKIRDYDPNTPNKRGGRIGIILNGSPLITGGAGSGESEIRRFVLQSDLLEAIVALPTDMFYNTGIATYVWILSNKKPAARKGKVQLINGVHLCEKMHKSLGEKRQVLGEEDIELITKTFGACEAVETYPLDKSSDEKDPRGHPARKKRTKRVFAAKLFENHEFGYRRITVQRPKRLSVQLTDERIETLRFARGPLYLAMQNVYKLYGREWTDNTYGDLSALHAEVRTLVKADFGNLKDKQLKELLSASVWLAQRDLVDKAHKLLREIGSEQLNDFNAFEDTLKTALTTAGVKLELRDKKQLLDAISWTNADAEPVVTKVLKTEANPLYGAIEYRGQVVRFKPDRDLRDNEDVPLTAATSRGAEVNAINEAYFTREVLPHNKDAWIDTEKCDPTDKRVGIVGYAIPFNRHFYTYEPPRDLREIDADLEVLSGEVMEMLRDARS